MQAKSRAPTRQRLPNGRRAGGPIPTRRKTGSRAVVASARSTGWANASEVARPGRWARTRLTLRCLVIVAIIQTGPHRGYGAERRI